MDRRHPGGEELMRPQKGIFNAGVSMPAFNVEQDGRFWRLVNKSPGQGPKGDCWLWKGHILKTGGYGQFYHSGGSPALRAHRVAYFLGKGEDPRQQDVLHSCDERLCCKPDHLSLGSRSQNNADRHAKGRTAKGLKVKGAILSDQQVRLLAKQIDDGALTYQEAAALYGMTSGGIWSAVNRCHKGIINRPRRQRRQMSAPTRATCENVKKDRDLGMHYEDIALKYDITTFTARAIYEGRLKRIKD
jgi:HNH endonuclease